ncbi:MAG: AbrB/MazE/SpoVT family DNA-binding domain-containing protein [Xanthobacteraceae bacterium]|nr:AbrB/MazE/SpoVT family DNA-binding domain-containing protein [Xanthobacteraceae bacterium]QYK45908.1 MAG: AbrB/MazE/SpoVT family DNA-binding domain-containing protein [Xanthobacteraceae bacterium]HMN50861.1 AbrB/MazE/SpoVT family DNA-binding domain-containing protein [Xanthobacteraceae bacterium]
MAHKISYRARSTLTSKGQITLPVVLRRLWDLNSGDEIDFTLQEDGRVLLRKRLRLPQQAVEN